MRIRDLVEPWFGCVAEHHDQAGYEALHPALFDHYYTFWSRRRPVPRPLNPADVRANRQLVLDRLQIIEPRFAESGFALHDLEVILFVGQGTTNGHAFSDHGAFAVWLPVETYDDESKTDVFLAHEIAHALHYTRSPDCYFDSLRQRHLLSRLLITEGVATYASRAILDVPEAQALWGGYLRDEPLAAWMQQCGDQWPGLCRDIAGHYNESIENSGYFCLLDMDDVARSRAGYFVGLRLIGRLVMDRELTLESLFSLSRPDLEDAVRRGLLAGASAA